MVASVHRPQGHFFARFLQKKCICTPILAKQVSGPDTRTVRSGEGCRAGGRGGEGTMRHADMQAANTPISGCSAPARRGNRACSARETARGSGRRPGGGGEGRSRGMHDPHARRPAQNRAFRRPAGAPREVPGRNTNEIIVLSRARACLPWDAEPPWKES